MVKSAPSLPRKQIKTAFRTAVNLTFTTGFERSANKLDAGRFEADARLFADGVLGGLCGDAAAKASAVEAAAAAGDVAGVGRLGPALERCCIALAAAVGECEGLNARGKALLKEQVSGAVQPLLGAMAIFVKLALSPAATSSSNSAASAVIGLFLSLLRTLGKELGIDFKTSVLMKLIDGVGTVALDGAKLTDSQLLVVRMLCNALRVVFRERGGAISGLVGNGAEVIIDKLAPICKSEANAAELMPGLVDLVYSLLCVQWAVLTVTESEGGAAGEGGGFNVVKIKVGGGGPAGMHGAHPLFAPGSLAPGKRVTRVKPNFVRSFDGLAYLLLFCIRSPTLPPNVVGMAVKRLLILGKKVKVRACEYC